MTKSYCVKQKKHTGCIKPSGYKTTQNGRLMHFCTCAECFITKTRFISKKDLYGGSLDIHKAILKIAPKEGFVMPGHRYTGPGNPLQKQVKWDENTGQILEIYEKPTGKTDAVSMQHDVEYSVCANKPSKDQVKCKNDADRKMVKSLDAIPWKDRQ